MLSRFNCLAIFAAFATATASLQGLPDKPVWPLTLRDGLPTELPGWNAAPREDLPEENENGMGKYVEVARFFQRIESATSVKQFRLVIQDYNGKDVVEALRKAINEAKKTSDADAREFEIDGHRAFSVTNRASAHPGTIVTVVVTPSRLVVGQGANVGGDEAIALVRKVDLAKVASIQH